MFKFQTKSMVFGMLAAAVLAVGAVSAWPSRVEVLPPLPYYQDASFTPHWLTDAEVIEHFHRVLPFRLMNQNGVAVTDASLRGKIYVASFFFTSCPGICPKMTENMKMVQTAFLGDDDVRLVSHSVTPTLDTVERLRAYAEKHGVDARAWSLVTGAQSEIYRLGRNAYFVEEDLGEARGPDDFLHTENFVLVDSEGHLRGIYNGLNRASVQQLIADIRTLKPADAARAVSAAPHAKLAESAVKRVKTR